MTKVLHKKGELHGLSYCFDQNWTELSSAAFSDVFYKQHKTHLDYFQHPKVQQLCFDIFSQTVPCYLLKVYKGERLIGYMGFRVGVKKIRYRNITFLVPIASNVAEFNFPVVDPSYLTQFFQILEHVVLGHNLYVEHVPGFFKEYFIQELPKSFVRHTVSNPIIQYTDEILAISQKKTLLKKKRRILRDYDLSITHLTQDITEDILENFFELHIERWNRSGVNSNFKQERFKELYRKLVKISIPKIGTPVLNCLQIDGEFLAMDLGFILGDDSHYLAQISSSKLNEKTSSAGSILNRDILEYMANRDIECFNLGVGMETYKYRYMNDVMTYYTMVKLDKVIDAVYQRATLK